MENFMFGNAAIYGNLVCKPSQLTQLDKTRFFKELSNSLKKNKLESCAEISFKISNLKKGITIGNDYFIIETV
jgi:hypothetical protein